MNECMTRDMNKYELGLCYMQSANINIDIGCNHIRIYEQSRHADSHTFVMMQL